MSNIEPKVPGSGLKAQGARDKTETEYRGWGETEKGQKCESRIRGFKESRVRVKRRKRKG